MSNLFSSFSCNSTCSLKKVFFPFWLSTVMYMLVEFIRTNSRFTCRNMLICSQVIRFANISNLTLATVIPFFEWSFILHLIFHNLPIDILNSSSVCIYILQILHLVSVHFSILVVFFIFSFDLFVNFALDRCFSRFLQFRRKENQNFSCLCDKIALHRQQTFLSLLFSTF